MKTIGKTTLHYEHLILSMKWLTYESNQVSNDNLIKSITYFFFMLNGNLKMLALGD